MRKSITNEVQYVILRLVKANDRGWGKFHLVRAETKTTLCSVKLRRFPDGRFKRPIESSLRELSDRARRRGGRKAEACKNCIKRAQKLRAPLDRLAEISLDS
jgi:hypothetical protein